MRLDFGTSRRIQSGVSVVKVIGGKFAMSMQLGLISFAISLVIGVVMGVLQARFKDGIIDGIGTIYTILVNAVPPLVAYSLVLVFGSHVLKLPSMYSTRNPGPSMILPVACLSLSSIAGYALWTRRYMVDELNKDYIKLARVKGLSSKRIMVTHVLRNAFVPLAQYIPYSIFADSRRFSSGRAFSSLFQVWVLFLLTQSTVMTQMLFRRLLFYTLHLVSSAYFWVMF